MQFIPISPSNESGDLIATVCNITPGILESDDVYTNANGSADLTGSFSTMQWTLLIGPAPKMFIEDKVEGNTDISLSSLDLNNTAYEPYINIVVNIYLPNIARIITSNNQNGIGLGLLVEASDSKSQINYNVYNSQESQLYLGSGGLYLTSGVGTNERAYSTITQLCPLQTSTISYNYLDLTWDIMASESNDQGYEPFASNENNNWNTGSCNDIYLSDDKIWYYSWGECGTSALPLTNPVKCCCSFDEVENIGCISNCGAIKDNSCPVDPTPLNPMPFVGPYSKYK